MLWIIVNILGNSSATPPGNQGKVWGKGWEYGMGGGRKGASQDYLSEVIITGGQGYAVLPKLGLIIDFTKKCGLWSYLRILKSLVWSWQH